jgi:hypothetical protein
MIASPLARRLCAPLAVLALLVPAAVSRGAAETGTFEFTNPIADVLDLSDTCLGTTGTMTGTETANGHFTENGPPAFGFHFHYTSTVDYRVDLADGRYVLASSVGHVVGNALDTEHDDDGPGDTDVGQFMDASASRDTGTLYSPDGQPLGTVTVHHNGHLIWRDENADGDPDPGEIRSEVDNLRLSCR